MITNSVSFRLLFGAVLWISLALLLTSLIVVRQVKTYSEALFDQELKEEALSLVTAATLGVDGQLSFSAPVQSQKYYRPFSGWYWQINLGEQVVSTSRSLWDKTLPVDISIKDPDGAALAIRGPRQERLRARQVYSSIEEGDLFILVGGDSKDIRKLRYDIAYFLLALFPLLVLLFVGFNYLTIRFGLKPLRRVIRELRRLNEGDIEKLSEKYPREIQPLANEINSLQNANNELIERARRQVGNLAHAIKTPLAIMRNATDNGDPALAEKTQGQALIIQEQIDRHLALARSAATTRQTGDPVDVKNIGDAIAKALVKIHADRDLKITIEISDDFILRADKSDVTEMLGNLMENAAKWCKTKIELKAFQTKNSAFITISDDGPGIPEHRHADALKRGKRLDERTPGTGLGLSIVSDMAEMHGGKLSLSDSAIGGLCAKLEFPAGS